ncbi:16S rRNA (cytosine(1402)-N(4))-methyltransferase RsmH [bacterium]|nr:16S rRNA (cytosine(1402)-N(4))-methyltransferase RsmH [bacterium]
MMYHEPVLLNEVLENLKIEKNKIYVDCTLGDGGHSIGILEKGGRVFGIDYNDESINRTKDRVRKMGLDENFQTIKENFKNIQNFIDYGVSGFLFDLGYSSFHLEGYGKGLSFQKDEELDMRVDTSRGVKAKDLLKLLDVKQLESIFRVFGEEKYSKRIAQEIVRKREVKEIHSTSDLIEIIRSVVPSQQVKINPATRVFQSLRIVVNQELENLKLALPQAESLTLPGGRILVITFHSLEEKLVKEFSRDFQPRIKLIGGGVILPSQDEVTRNPRSRSAKLFVLEKI